MLTKQQADLLDFLADRQKMRRMPSFDEMAEHLGLRSKSGIHRLITALEARGFIKRWKRHARAIVVIRTGFKDVCPHCKGLGHIEAAAPTADRRVA